MALVKENTGMVTDIPTPPLIVCAFCVSLKDLNLKEFLVAGYIPLAANPVWSANVLDSISDFGAVFESVSALLLSKSTPSPDVCENELEEMLRPVATVWLILIARVVATRITSLC
jgi:hypothetical protein